MSEAGAARGPARRRRAQARAGPGSRRGSRARGTACPAAAQHASPRAPSARPVARRGPRATPAHRRSLVSAWSAPQARRGRWLGAGAAGGARPGARRSAARPPAAPWTMEPPWELELELRQHIETCACTCDHMGYGNYMDYHQVAPAGHACHCRALTSPLAHVSTPTIRVDNQITDVIVIII